MKALTPKEWRARNEQKMTEGANSSSNTSGYQGERVHARQDIGDTGTGIVDADADKGQVETHSPLGSSRKRVSSEPQLPTRPAPAFRRLSPTSLANSHNKSSVETHSASTSHPLPKPAARPAPKMKTANLFIPKKPPVSNRYSEPHHLTHPIDQTPTSSRCILPRSQKKANLGDILSDFAH